MFVANDVPTVPPELILLPRWFPVHLSKMSYWARTVIVPLLVLCALKPLAKQSARHPYSCTNCSWRGVPARQSPRAPHQSAGWVMAFFGALDRVLKSPCPGPSQRARDKAIAECRAWTTERLNGEDGLGAIYPAMANSVMMYDVLGYRAGSSRPRHCAQVRRKPAGDQGRYEAYCQPCVSPVWDTALVAHALLETKDDAAAEAAVAARAGMAEAAAGAGCRRATGRKKSPTCGPAAGPSSIATTTIPDLDDTAVVVMALDRAWRSVTSGRCAIARGREWVEGLQSRDGGWGAFDADNSYYYLNNIPFADHGALLDPPTEDVSGRCVGMLAQLGVKN